MHGAPPSLFLAPLDNNFAYFLRGHLGRRLRYFAKRLTIANAAPEKAPSLPSVHDPFARATGAPEKVAGQNIVCARTSAGYPIANKPVMPKDTARLENLRIARRMPRPVLKQAMITLSLHNIWLHNCTG